MKYNTPHGMYAILLVVSAIIASFTFFIQNGSWNAILASIGAGGIASAGVAWLIDIRDTKIQAMESKKKMQVIMFQFVQIYRRMFWVAANECYGYRKKNDARSFQAWLSLLSSIEPYCPKEGQTSMRVRCTRLSGCIVSLQRQIEIFQSQSATLVFEEFPDIEQSLHAFEILLVHCWGTLKLLEVENYKAFCDTTYILYTDFINAFPQYADRFPTEYSVQSFKP